MLRLAFLDPTWTGRQAEDMEKMAPAGRPVGNSLFLGPTGFGKRRVVEATAESLVNDSRSIIKIDCAEFQHSNVRSPDDIRLSRQLSARVSDAGMAAARGKFTPEFINRLDNIVVFKSLGAEELRAIVDIELDMVQQRVQSAAGSKPFRVDVTDTASEFLLVEGADSRYGARHLKRAIERLLVQPLSNLMASRQAQRSDCIRVSRENGSAALIFGREPETVHMWEVCGRAA